MPFYGPVEGLIGLNQHTCAIDAGFGLKYFCG